MAKGPNPGKGAPRKGGGSGRVAGSKPVGYGDKGKAFYNPAKYNASKSGQAHAKNPSLSTKPVGKGAKGNVFFSKAKFNASKSGPMNTKTHGPIALSAGQQAHFAHAEVAKATPVPKAPAGMKANPVMRARGVK
jgi:hypothetical protein